MRYSYCWFQEIDEVQIKWGDRYMKSLIAMAKGVSIGDQEDSEMLDYYKSIRSN